jgi:hypothetical protein
MNKDETIDFLLKKTLIAGKMKNSATKITIAFYRCNFLSTNAFGTFDLNQISPYENKCI